MKNIDSCKKIERSLEESSANHEVISSLDKLDEIADVLSCDSEWFRRSVLVEPELGFSLFKHPEGRERIAYQIVSSRMSDAGKYFELTGRNWAGDGIDGKAGLKRFLARVGVVEKGIDLASEAYDLRVDEYSRGKSEYAIFQKKRLEEDSRKINQYVGKGGTIDWESAMDFYKQGHIDLAYLIFMKINYRSIWEKKVWSKDPHRIIYSELLMRHDSEFNSFKYLKKVIGLHELSPIYKRRLDEELYYVDRAVRSGIRYHHYNYVDCYSVIGEHEMMCRRMEANIATDYFDELPDEMQGEMKLKYAVVNGYHQKATGNNSHFIC